MSTSDLAELKREMEVLRLDSKEFDLADPSTKSLVNSIKTLNNPGTTSEDILKLFENFKKGGKNSIFADQSPVLSATIKYWHRIYVKIMEARTNSDVKKATRSLFDPSYDIHHQSGYKLGQSFMKTTMHLVYKKLFEFNPDIDINWDLVYFPRDIPQEVTGGELIFNKIFAKEMRK